MLNQMLIANVFLYSFVALFQILNSTELVIFVNIIVHMKLMDKIYLLHVLFQTLLRNIYEKKNRQIRS